MQDKSVINTLIEEIGEVAMPLRSRDNETFAKQSVEPKAKKGTSQVVDKSHIQNVK